MKHHGWMDKMLVTRIDPYSAMIFFTNSDSNIRFLALTLYQTNKFLDWSVFKAFADDKINVTAKLKYMFRRVENSVGNGDNTGYQHFLLSPQCFQKFSSSGFLKVWTVW